MTFKGSGFLPTATAYFGTTPLETTVLDANTVSALIPAQLLAISGRFELWVQNPEEPAAGVYLDVLPAALGTDPQNVPVGSVPPIVTVMGIGFNPSCQIEIVNGGVSSLRVDTTLVSSTTLTFTIPVPDLNAPAHLLVLVRDCLPNNTVVAPSLDINPPYISASLPASAAAGGPDLIISIIGGGFAPTSVVNWNGAALQTTYEHSAKLLATVPAALLITGFPSLTVSTGPFVSSAVQFQVVSGGLISSVNPTSINAGTQPFSLTVTGSSFLPSSVVLWNGTPLQTTYDSPTQLRATVPGDLIHLAGKAEVKVRNLDNTTSNAASVKVHPVLLNLAPGSVAAVGRGPMLFALEGRGFISTCRVVVAPSIGSPFESPSTVVDSQRIETTLPAELFAHLQKINIFVTDPDAGGSLPAILTVSAPEITAITPTAAFTGASGVTLSVEGFWFIPSTVVLFQGTVLQTTYINESKLTAAVPAGLLAAAGSRSVTVANGPFASNDLPFSVTEQQSLTVNSVSPDPLRVQGGSATLTVSGAGFFPGATVNWSGTPLATTFQSSVLLTAVLPPPLCQTPGQFILDVTNPGGQTSNPLSVIQQLSITSVWPTTLPVGGGSISVSGASIPNGSSIKIAIGDKEWLTGGVVFTSFGGSSISGTLSGEAVQAPAEALVSVVHPGLGLASNSLPISIKGPQIRGLMPSSATAGARTFDLIVDVDMVVHSATVYWNQTPLATRPGVDNTLIATVPANLLTTPGQVAIAIAAGVVRSNELSFNVVSGPTLTRVEPDSIVAGSGAIQLTVTGTGFVNHSFIEWPGLGMATTFIDSTTLRGQLTADKLTFAGRFNVWVVNPDGAVTPSLSVEIRPVLLSLNPATVSSGLDATITATGTGFTPAAVLVLDSDPLSTTYLNSSTLRATIPANRIPSPADRLIRVVDAGGVASENLPLHVVEAPPPTLTALKPAQTNPGTALLLTVSGANFLPGAKVMWETLELPTTWVSATELTATVSAQQDALAGRPGISVVNPNGAATNAVPFEIRPALNSLEPSAVRAGGPAAQVIARGAGFTSNARILFGSDSLPTTYLDSSTLRAVIPADRLQSVATVSVHVLDRDGVETAGLSFSIVKPEAPLLSSLNPDHVTAGAAAFTLTLSGSNFLTGSSVDWSGVQLVTTYVSATELTAAVPADLLAEPGSAGVLVRHPLSDPSNALTFTIATNAPAISSLDPAEVFATSPAFNLTVHGAGFVPASLVRWNGLPLDTTYIGSTQLAAEVPASLLSDLGDAAITVVNPDGLTSPRASLSVNSPVPVIHALDPASATAGGPQFTLTVTGARFTKLAVIRWNGSPLDTTYINSARLTASVPATLIATAGAADILVVNPAAYPPEPAPFIINPPGLILSTLEPPSAAANGPTFTLAVLGAGFTPDASVNWNGTPLTTTFTGSAHLTAAVPASLIATPGTAQIDVVQSIGASNPIVFTILGDTPEVPAGGVVSALAPMEHFAPGSLISIYGLHLARQEETAQAAPLRRALADTTVWIDEVAIPLLFVSPGQINAQVPFEIAVGGASLIVEMDGMKSEPVNLKIAPAAPTILAAYPGSHAIAVNVPGGTLNSPEAPAAPGRYVTLYLTGQGAVDPPVASGDPAPFDPLAMTVAPVAATLGGQPVKITFAGLAPGFVGLLQVNLIIPELPAGEHTLDLSIGGASANPVALSIGSN